MKNRICVFLGLGLFALVAFYGCRPDPKPDIRGAQHAKEKAEGYHSDVMAAPEWKEALQAWEEAQAALQKGEYPRPQFRKAKALFDKTIAAAQANGRVMEKEIQSIQNEIDEKYMKVNPIYKRGGLKPKIQKELKPLLDQVAINSGAIKDLIVHFNYLQAKEKVLETQKIMLEAEKLALKVS
jgi:hypothetical protein